MIKVRNVNKALGKFRIKDLSFELPTGYIMGLVGANGAGKTSLIHILLGLYQADKGEVLIDNMSYETEEIKIRNKIGYVLMESLFIEGMTLLENGRHYGKFYEKYEEPVLKQYLRRFGLDEKRTYKKLSRGEKIKFQFAFALSHDARLLILDEPTGNLDVNFRKDFFRVLKEFIADGDRSVILSTHLTDDLDRVADYLLYMENGSPVFYGDIETLRRSYRLLVGEEYKLKLLPEKTMIHMESGNYGYRALVHHRKNTTYDNSLTVSIPTIEELMYFITKREKKL